MSRRRTLVALSLTAALAGAGATPASAGPDKRPDTLPLVTGSLPEGISAGPGNTFFAGARSDGAIYVGDARRAGVSTLVPGQANEVAVGLLYDERTQRLWVAGGATGDVKAYDARTGRLLFLAETGAGRFLNDVAVTREAVFVTDSTKNQIVVVPLGRAGELPAPGTFDVLSITGDYVQPAGFGLNGVRVLPGGDLITVSGGRLYVVDPATGVADLVEVSGTRLTGGDGLVLRGNLLYVVRGLHPTASVVVLRLEKKASSARFVEEIRNPDFNVPTTAAFVGGDLLVVNGQFGDPATAPTEVVRVDRP